MRYHNTVIFALGMLDSHSGVVHAMPQDNFNTRGNLGGNAARAVAAGGDAGPELQERCVTVRRDTESDEVNKRVTIQPVPEDLSNFLSWVQGVVTLIGCAYFVQWVGKKLVVHFTDETQRANWKHCLAHAAGITPESLQRYIDRARAAGHELQEALP
ncbi:hypothetical protein F4778DRAFT_795195 [Xylariomycetidae sp. FL2044]|nr:hypothetical protein F4778DRAFT_795195 [Xylariomycetidae sp. FL2044]